MSYTHHRPSVLVLFKIKVQSSDANSLVLLKKSLKNRIKALEFLSSSSKMSVFAQIEWIAYLIEKRWYHLATKVELGTLEGRLFFCLTYTRT